MIVLIGLALRLYRINWQSTWYDENSTLAMCQLDWAEMFRWIIRNFVHPPLHYVLLRLWMNLFGFGQLPARLFSAFVGTLSIPLLYLVVRHWFSRRAGLLAAFLLAISQLAVNHSQEGRPYALELFLVLCCVYCFSLALATRRLSWWGGFTIFGALMLYTHYYTVFVLGALFLFWAAHRKEYPIPRGWWIGSAACIALAFAPWLASGVIDAALNSSKLDKPVGPMSMHWYSPVSTLNWFNNGKWNGIYRQSPLWSYPAGALLISFPATLAAFSLLAWSRRLRTPPHRKGLLLFLALWLIPMGAVLSMSAVLRLQFDVRYLVVSLFPYYALAAVGIANLKRPFVRAALLAAVTAYSLGALRANYFIPYKPDLRGAAAFVAEQYRDGDCVLFMPPSKFGDPPLYWRALQPERSDVRACSFDEVVAGSSGGYDRLWLIWDGTWWKNKRPGRRKQATEAVEATHARDLAKRFYSVDVRLYRPKDD